MYLEYKKEIIPKALILETMIPEDMVTRLNELLDKVSEDKKYKFEHNAAPTLAGVIKKGFQVYLDQKESIIQEYTNLTHELSKKYIQEFSILSQNNYSDKMIKTEDIWSVHQYEGDYNPIHSHNVPGNAPGFATVDDRKEACGWVLFFRSGSTDLISLWLLIKLTFNTLINSS